MAPPLLKYTVLKKNFLTHDVFELHLKRPEGIQFEAGQYMSIVIPGAGPGGRNLRRAYSIASPPESEALELCIKIVPGGPGTTYLNSLKEGDHFEAQAPFGDFVLEQEAHEPALFIGTGTGIAPLRSMILSKKWNPTTPFGFLLGVRAEEDILYPEFFNPNKFTGILDAEMSSIFANQKHAQITLSRPKGTGHDAWQGFKGRVTDYLKSMDWDHSKSHYYLCGNGDMIKEVKEFLTEKGVDKDRIHLEKYF